MIKQQHRFMIAYGCVEIIIKHHEDVHIIRNGLLGHKRPKHHKPCEVPGCSRDAMNPSDTLKQDLTLTTCTAKCSCQFAQSATVHSNGKIALGAQRREWNCPSP